MDHDDQTWLVDDCAHAEAETVKYGYKDPSIDLLRHSYFHIWVKSGQHIGWHSFAQHKEKCIAADISPLPERTFYRWRNEEENACKRSEAFDASLHFLSQEGFLEQAKQAHKVAQEQRQKDKQQALFDAMKVWESKNGSLDGFDSLKVDIISVSCQVCGIIY